MNKLPTYGWLLVLAAVLTLLQVFPITGLFLMFVGGPFLTGAVLQLALFAFIFEAIAGRIPRRMLLVPFALFFLHFIYVFVQTHVIAQFEEEIQNSNGQNTFVYDPRLHSLVVDETYFVDRYNVPIAFTERENWTAFPNQNHLAHVLTSKKQCNSFPRDSKALLTKRINEFENECHLEVPTAPTKKIIRLDRKRRNERYRGFKFDVTTFSITYQDKEIAHYRTASIQRLKHYPFFILGCMLIDMPSSWPCFAHFHSQNYELETTPRKLRATSKADPIELFLGIKKRTSITPEDERAAERIIKIAKNLDNMQVQNSYTFLEKQLANPSLKAPKWLYHYLTLQHEQLLSYQDLLLKSFFKNSGVDHKLTRKHDKVVYAVAGALAHIQRKKLIQNMNQLLSILSIGNNINNFSLLSLRLSELDTRYKPHYIASVKKDITSTYKGVNFYHPDDSKQILALCRIQKLDGEILNLIQTEIQSEKALKYSEYSRSLFLTLLRHGRQNFLEQWLLESRPKEGAEWYKKVLQQHQKEPSELPSNCMVPKLFKINLPPSMKPWEYDD